MGIFDDLKMYWQKDGIGLPQRTGVNVIGNTFPTDAADRLDLLTPGNSPLYVWYALSPPGTNLDDLWLSPYGLNQKLDIAGGLGPQKLCVPVGRKTYLDSLGFHMISAVLATDSVEITITNGTSATPLTLTVPPGTTNSQFIFVTLPQPVVWEADDTIGCRLRQSGSVVVASWNAYIVAC